jgi:arginyl-tRNA synthetase
MSLAIRIKEAAAKAIKEAYAIDLEPQEITLSQTKPEFEGDYTIVLFTLVKQLRKSPEVLGKEIGEKMILSETGLFSSYNVIKGFLNLSLCDSFYIQFLQENFSDTSPVSFAATAVIVVTFSYVSQKTFSFKVTKPVSQKKSKASALKV